jgi:hypothetical protein
MKTISSHEKLKNFFYQGHRQSALEEIDAMREDEVTVTRSDVI